MCVAQREALSRNETNYYIQLQLELSKTWVSAFFLRFSLVFCQLPPPSLCPDSCFLLLAATSQLFSFCSHQVGMGSWPLCVSHHSSKNCMTNSYQATLNVYVVIPFRSGNGLVIPLWHKPLGELFFVIADRGSRNLAKPQWGRRGVVSTLPLQDFESDSDHNFVTTPATLLQTLSWE